MKIVVVGTGDMGGAIARALAERTLHDVRVCGSRSDSASAKKIIAANPERIRAATEHDIAMADAVFLAVPWDAIDAATDSLTAFAGSVISVVVPWSADGQGDPRTTLTSAAERIAARLPAARVACAFTSISSQVVDDPGQSRRPSVVACGDDEACAVALSLARELGFSPVRGGGLQAARYAEGLGLLWASLAYDAGYGERVAYEIFVA